MKKRWKDWLKQAIDDLQWAEATLKAEKYSQVCFISQQIAEKAIKALAFFRGVQEIRSHSVREIAQCLEVNGEIEKIAKRLDMYYISARYPDAFPSGAPFEYFTAEQAEEAFQFAQKLVEIIKHETAFE